MPDSTLRAIDQSASNDAGQEIPQKDNAEIGESSDAAADQEPQVSPPSPTEPKAVTNLAYRPSTTFANRGRVVTLERRQDLMLGAEVQGKGDDHDDDNSTVTSDGESSYFAKHLPSPKSGRLPFASDAGSISSAPARTEQMNETADRESAASLSFSDDEEEEVEDTPLSPPLVPWPKDTLQFRGIARMHSANSLASAEDRRRPSEFDQSEAELRHLKASRRFADRGNRPRNNPGHAFFSRESSQSLQPSPPPILSQFPAMAGAIHPQPFHPNRMQALSSGDNANANADALAERLSISLTSATDESKGSHGTVTMVYSEDDDTAEVMAPTVASSVSGEGGGVFRHLRSISSGKPSEEDLLHAKPRSAKMQKRSSGRGLVAAGNEGVNPGTLTDDIEGPAHGFKVYWRRWVMLFYMSLLNLLSDWTCYSVAPIAFLTREAFGSIDPEQLVVVFLVANAVATACEPIILARLGLRRTIIFGSLLLMLGSIVKSGGLAPIIASTLEKGKGEWRVYLGFFLVGLSQPLYQCTPALLSASWFPEEERTMATGVALNANQLGIGCAFAFGTLLVGSSDDIVPYFSLLSIISVITFIGTLIQFDDAPPTPPSDTAKVIRGTMEWKLPNTDAIWNSVRNFGNSNDCLGRQLSQSEGGPACLPRHGNTREAYQSQAPRRRTSARQPNDDGKHRNVRNKFVQDREKQSNESLPVLAPSPMLPGRVGQGAGGPEASAAVENSVSFDDIEYTEGPDGQGMPPGSYNYHPYGAYPTMHSDTSPFVGYPNILPGQSYPVSNRHQLPPYQHQHWAQHHPQYQQGAPMYGAPQHQPPLAGYYHADPYHHPYQQYPPQYQPYFAEYDEHNISLAPPSYIEEYAEPTLTLTDHHLDINIRDDQVLLSVKACMARRGFVHALVTFTVSGIVINTLSTYMDYLVRLNGAGREYVGIVGGSFQVVIMISSLIVGKQTDKTRAYYSVTIAMLVLGAFALAECGVSLDADRGGDLRWSLIVVAALVGPLQPVSTELGVEVAFPLSENTVLVIQQLFSNLLSAMFIPFFKALRDVGTERISETELYERPQYTFSFYLLIVLHAGVTVFFATFNGRYLRYERELVRQEQEKRGQVREAEAFEEVFEQNFDDGWRDRYENDSRNDSLYPNEREPLVAGKSSGTRR